MVERRHFWRATLYKFNEAAHQNMSQDSTDASVPHSLRQINHILRISCSQTYPPCQYEVNFWLQLLVCEFCPDQARTHHQR